MNRQTFELLIRKFSIVSMLFWPLTVSPRTKLFRAFDFNCEEISFKRKKLYNDNKETLQLTELNSYPTE